MKVAIVGAGALGTLVGYLLHRAGYAPWLFDRSREQVEIIEQAGLTVEDAEGIHHAPLCTATTDPQKIGCVDLIVIAVKAYDTGQAMRDSLPLLGEETVVLTLQNGLYNLETIAGIVGRERVLGGVTAHGATRLGYGHIRHAGSGETIIGSLSGAQDRHLASVCDLLNASGIRTAPTDDLRGTIWSKLIINAAVNPLTALTRLTNGEIIERSELLDLLKRITEEGCAVAAARGITIYYDNPLEKVKEVCRATAANRSSMLQDVLNRKKTEIDYINGALVSEGESCNRATPYNQVVSRLVKALEIRGAL